MGDKSFRLGGHDICLRENGDIQLGMSWVLPKKGPEFVTSVELLLRDCFESGVKASQYEMRQALGIDE